MAEEPGKLDITDEMIAERRGGSGPMPKDMPKWMASTITKIDLFSKWIGNVVCWITIPLILAKIKGIVIQQTTLPIHLLNKSIFVIVDAIHFGISFGIGPEPPRLSAIISSVISNFPGSSAIKKFELNKKRASNCPLYKSILDTILMFLREPFLA